MLWLLLLWFLVGPSSGVVRCFGRLGGGMWSVRAWRRAGSAGGCGRPRARAAAPWSSSVSGASARRSGLRGRGRGSLAFPCVCRRGCPGRGSGRFRSRWAGRVRAACRHRRRCAAGCPGCVASRALVSFLAGLPGWAAPLPAPGPAVAIPCAGPFGRLRARLILRRARFYGLRAVPAPGLVLVFPPPLSRPAPGRPPAQLPLL